MTMLQDNLQIQWNSDQNIKYFHKTITSNSKICRETQNIPNSKQSWERTKLEASSSLIANDTQSYGNKEYGTDKKTGTLINGLE